MIHRPCSEFFAASCTQDGGAYRYRLYESGKLELIQKIPMPGPMFLVQQGELLWAVLRAPFAGCEESGVAAYDIRNGKQATELFSTKGVVACHITADNGEVWCANYSTGSVFKVPELLKMHRGHGVDPVRQTAPHVHFVCLAPDKECLLSCDLGLDTVFVYDRDLNLVSSAKVPNGAGVRHLVFSKDGKFVYCTRWAEASAFLHIIAVCCGILIPYRFCRRISWKRERGPQSSCPRMEAIFM